MTEPGTSTSSRMQAAAAGAAAKPSGVRVNVEQASYSYTLRRHAAPVFTLETTTFQARDRELVAILGPNASGLCSVARSLRPQRRRPGVRFIRGARIR